MTETSKRDYFLALIMTLFGGQCLIIVSYVPGVALVACGPFILFFKPSQAVIGRFAILAAAWACVLYLGVDAAAVLLYVVFAIAFYMTFRNDRVADDSHD